MPTKHQGAFITLEGCEGSGKSTQLNLLKEYLDNRHIDSLFTREPGGVPISEKIREIILDGKNTAMSDETEALLYAAARVQHLKEKVAPSIKEGKLVVCDRYIDSSFAYQAYARNLGFDFVAKVNSFAMQNCLPNLTIFLDINPQDAFKRKGGADKDDRIEQSGMDFHNKVYLGYIELSKKFPERIVKIDATKGADEVFKDIVGVLQERGIIAK